jgi:DNA-directed RNA polymerase specialized sigma subunit
MMPMQIVPLAKPKTMSRRRHRVYPKLTPEQQKLVTDHKWIAGRLAHGALCRTNGYTGSLTREDLESVANFALCVAASKFNPGLNIRYSTYAWKTAKGYIQHALRDYSRMVRTPRWATSFQSRVAQMLAEGQTYDDVASELGLDKEKVRICEMSVNNYHVSYDSQPDDWVSPEFVYNCDAAKATLLSPELRREIEALTDPEMSMLLKYVGDQGMSEEEREWASEKFFELQSIAHGFTEEN